jgi:hypothetical protein
MVKHMAVSGSAYRSYEKGTARPKYVVPWFPFAKIPGLNAPSSRKWKSWNLFTNGGKGSIG